MIFDIFERYLTTKVSMFSSEGGMDGVGGGGAVLEEEGLTEEEEEGGGGGGRGGPSLGGGMVGGGEEKRGPKRNEMGLRSREGRRNR